MIKMTQQAKIIFVRLSNRYTNDPFARDNIPPFDLLHTQEQLKKDCQIHSRLIDEQVHPALPAQIAGQCLDCSPKVIVLSCISIKILECLEFFKLIKQADPGIICVAVGHLATYCTSRICNSNSPVDFIVRGEFQQILPGFLKQLISCGKISYIKENTDVFSKQSKSLSKLHIIDDINKLPDISYTKRMLADYNNIIPIPVSKRIIWGRVFSSFGCPNKCIFCSQTIRLTYGQNYRIRRTDRIIKEIKKQLSLGANIIEFSDDNFTASKKQLFSVCQSIIDSRLNIKWGTHARIDDLCDDSLILMKKSGCIYIRCGIESGSEKILSSIQKTQEAPEWIKKSKHIFQLCKRLRIATIANIMIGTPHETEEDIDKTRELISDLNPDIIQVHYFCPYPGSASYDKIPVELTNKEIAEMHHHKESSVFLKNRQRKIITAFFLRPGYIVRHLNKFGLYYILNTDKFWPLLISFLRIFKK